MNSFQPLSQESLPFQKANSLGYHECCQNISAKEKCLARPVTFLRDSRHSRGSMPRQELAGKSNLAGSSFHGNADSSAYGGNSRSVSIDDAQVVPDFDDLLETISNSRVLQEEPLQTCSLRRGNTERDELDIYFPCVVTPIPVDNLYSTLNEDSSIFKFPLSEDEVVFDDKLESLNTLSVLSFSDITPVNNFLIDNDRHDKTKGSGNQCLQVPLVLKAEQDSNRDEEERLYIDNRPKEISWNEEPNLTLLSSKSRNVFNFQMPFICRYSPGVEKKEQSCCSADLSTHERNPPSIDSFVVQMPNPKLLDDSNPRKHYVSFDKLPDNRNHNDQYDKYGSSQRSFMRHGGRKPSLRSRQSLGTGLSEQSPQLKDGKAHRSTRGNTRQIRNQNSPQVAECELRHTEPRDVHNDMEKQRRTNMKTRFQKLQLVVPELAGSAKASKIVILRNAFEYINALEKESVNLENVKRIERQRNTELLEKLQKITSGSC